MTDAAGRDRSRQHRAVSTSGAGSFRRWRGARLPPRRDVRWSPPSPTCGTRGACRRWRAPPPPSSRRRWRLGGRLANALLVARSGGARGLLFHAGGDVAQQHASADAGVRRGGRLCDGACSRSPTPTRSRRRARRRGCSRCSRCCTARCWSASATSSACRRSCAPTGASSWRGAAASARSSPASGTPRSWPRPAGAGDPAAALCVRARAADARCCTPALAWPARSCCSKR